MADETAAVKKRKVPKAIKVLLVLSVVFSLMGAGAYMAIQSMLGPAEGVIVTQVPIMQSAQPAVELEQFEGQLLTFAHPVAYDEQIQKQPGSKSLEAHTFVATGVASKVLTMVVTSLPSGKLDDDASYTMRKLHPERYKLSELQIKGEKVIVALNSEEHQRTAFWPHGGKLLTFTLTGLAVDTAGVADEYEKMLQSVTWR